jgi:hypothetical protein
MAGGALVTVDLSRYFALLSYQRSGTNMVGWAVDSHPGMTYADEVFHRDNYPHPRSIGDLLETLATGVRPGSRHGAEVPYDDPGVERILVDAKYNQVNDAVEKFLRMVPVVHLIRRDDEKHFHSFALRSFWGAHPDMRARREMPESLPFDRRRFERFVDAKRRCVQWGEALADLTLYYEDLCGDEEIDELPEDAGRAMCDLVGLEYEPLAVPTRKSATEGVLW